MVAWFIVPYKRLTTGPGAEQPFRYPAIFDFDAQIKADGGTHAHTEILGNTALVKVRASAATLTAIAGAPGVMRIPNHTALTDTLGDLTSAQRTAILNKLQALGYSLAEIQAALPANWQSVTLGQVLRFAATRRLKPRHDAASDTIILDGPVQPVWPVEDVDAAVQ